MRAGFQYAHFQLNNATLNYILPSYLYRATPLTANVADPLGLTRGSELFWGAAFPGGGAPHPGAVSYVRAIVAENAAWDWKTFADYLDRVDQRWRVTEPTAADRSARRRNALSGSSLNLRK